MSTTGSTSRVQIADRDVTAIGVGNGAVSIEARQHGCSVVLDVRTLRRALACVEAERAAREGRTHALAWPLADEGEIDGSGL